MKLLLGIDLTDKDNRRFDGEPFVTRRLSEPLEREYEDLSATDEQLKKERSLPAVLRGIRWLAGMTAIAIPCLLLENCSFESRKQTSKDMNAAMLLVILSLVMVLIWVLITRLEIKLARIQKDSPEYHSAENDSIAFLQAAKNDLGVPENAVEMDMLASKYHWVNGSMYSITSRLIWFYGNIQFSAWQEADCLCLADHTMRFDIPLDAFRGVERRKNGYYISAWNKPSSYRSPEYKAYRIGITNGQICARGYLAIRLEYQGEDYELRVPPWEEEPLRRITGWTV